MRYDGVRRVWSRPFWCCEVKADVAGKAQIDLGAVDKDDFVRLWNRHRFALLR